MKRTWLTLAAAAGLFLTMGADCDIDIDTDDDDWFEDLFDKAIVTQSQSDEGPLSFLA